MELPPELEPLRRRAGEAAIFCDYDGTLAPIVPDPSQAVPAVAVPGLLARLARKVALVAVVSGRPVEYLAAVLGPPEGVLLAGLYGMEEVGADGVLRRDPEAEAWRPIVAEVTNLTAGAAPSGAEVEAKGLSVTFHWRRAPEAERWARSVARREARRTGLIAQPGRMAIELRPPVGADKGTVVRRLGERYPVVAYFGDDLGDLPAFAALDDLAAAGATALRVAVTDAETSHEVAEAADLVVPGPLALVGLLEALAGG